MSAPGDLSPEDAEKNGMEPDNGDLSLDEYTALNRYISTYRDPRSLAVQNEDDDDDALGKKKVPWWAPWRRRSRGGKTHGDGTFVVPDDWLQTDIRDGLKSGDVEPRRKRVGWNELTVEKENLFLKFLSYFMGPILYGGQLPYIENRA